MSYRRDTDSTGIVVEYRPLRDLTPGNAIAGGWRPWRVVKATMTKGDRGRVLYEHGWTDWFSADELFPVVVEDPRA